MNLKMAAKQSLIGMVFACGVLLGSGIAGAATFQYGDFNPGNLATSPPGTSYDFSGLGFSFSTNPLAYQWGYYIGGNPPPNQDASSVQTNVQNWTGLTLTSVVEQLDSFPANSTGFSTSVLAEIIAVHIGQGELVFIFNTATLFTLSNYLHCGNCPDGVVKVGGLSNFRTFNYTNNDGNNGNPNPVPLPAALPMLLVGLGGLGWLSRRRKHKLATKN